MEQLVADCHRAGAPSGAMRACTLAAFEARFNAIGGCAGDADMTTRLASEE
jgi:hypothetical protein